ncbi:hypothetical protein QCA50_014477 [Cerrena zonata]|uniref:Alpha/beta hydrolase fold-3 domain-containing protein n=1 Tax=Cerrena zonata TaxID=2478898 RepID=A0AAW0FRT2_9APHY
MSHNAHLAEADTELAALLAKIPRTEPPNDINLRRKLFNELALPKVQACYKADAPDAFVLGSVEVEDYLLRRISVELQLVTVNVEYRLAPEYPYPNGLNDGYVALKWVTANAKWLSVSLEKGFIIAGCSAGGNLAASLALRARDDPFFLKTPLTGQLLQIPQVLHPEAWPEGYDLYSREQNKDSAFVSRAEQLQFSKLYKGPTLDPAYSVLLAPEHRGLPRTYVQVCGADILRDEGLLYEKKLKESGVKTKLDVYPGVPHGAHVLFQSIPACKKMNQDFDNGLKWLLRRPPSRT